MITSEYPHKEERLHKPYSALGFFTLALALMTEIWLGIIAMVTAVSTLSAPAAP
ncbi:MAG: hypothetical protein R3310_12000 [Candidatus Competibacteraceae bacterium]|nr:hypothetical protein [Candidatus Competibacteraceae bacterium]